MNTAWTKYWRPLSLGTATLYVAVALVTSGCQRRCQPSSGTSFRFLSNAEWRLVETDNPGTAYRDLDRFNFQVWQFTTTFAGTIKKVQNNEQYETPILTFRWNADTDQDLVRIAFAVPGSGDGTGEGDTEASDAGTIDYYYTLGGELNLTEVRRGYNYRFVQMQGIVEPDNDCVF